MFFKLPSFFIGMRYLKPNKNYGMVSIISLFSFLGIILGVGTLIIVMSVMNGFKIELLDKIIGINGHLSIYVNDKNTNLSILRSEINKEPEIESIRLILDGQALIHSKDLSTGVFVKGINNEDFLSLLKNKVKISKEFDFSQNKIVIGEKLLLKLNVKIGDKIKLIIPKSSNTAFGNIPKVKTFYIGGFFNSGMYTYDNNLIFLDYSYAQKLFENKRNQSFLEINLKNIDFVDNFKKKISKLNISNYRIYDWRHSNATFFNAIKTEKNVMFLILSLIILVAAFNIISSLIMLVKNKQIDIAILRTMGASKKTIMKIFFINGAIIGCLGTFFGSILGILFVLNINSLKNFLENFTETELFSEEIYFLSNLPAKIEFNEVLYVIIISLLISFIASLYPAWRASKQNPIELIRKE